MATVILGYSRCKICGEVLDRDRPFTMFPAVHPENMEYDKFYDAAVHTDCFRKEYSNWEDIDQMFERALKKVSKFLRIAML